MTTITFSLIICFSFLFPVAGHSGVLEPSLPEPIVPETVELRPNSPFPEWIFIWKQARSAAREGNFTRAARRYQELLMRNPNISEAHWELARVSLARGLYDQAADLLDGLLPEYQDRLEVLLTMAHVQEELGQCEKALRFYMSALKNEGNNIRALSGVARCLLYEGEDKKAVPYLERLHENGKGGEELAEILAGIYYDLKLYQKVLEVLIPLVETGDPSGEALFLAAKSSASLNNADKAFLYWQELLKRGIERKEAHGWLADYYYGEKRNCRAALNHLLALHDIMSPDKNLFLRITHCYIQLNELQKGLDFVNHYLSHQSDDREALRLLVNINASLGREDQTLAALDRYFAVESRPSPEKLKQAARLYDARGRYREAIPLYKRLLQKNPNDRGLLKTLAEDLLAIGEDEGALHILNQLAVVSPEPEIYQAMADLLEKLNRCDELILVLERLHIKNPADPETIFKLISLYLDKNEDERAEVLYREVADDLLASAELLRKRGEFAIFFGMREHALRDYSRLLEMEYDREICLAGAGIAGSLGLVPELREYTALYLQKSAGLNSSSSKTADQDILRKPVFQSIGEDDYLYLAQAWRDAFLHETSRRMYRFITGDSEASGNIRSLAFFGLAGLFHQEGRMYKAEEAYRMAIVLADNPYSLMGSLVETCLEADNYEKASTWLSLMKTAGKRGGPGPGNRPAEDISPQEHFADRPRAVDWYREFLEVKMGIYRGAFRDAVARGEILLGKIPGKVNYGTGPQDGYPKKEAVHLQHRVKKLLIFAYVNLHEFERAEQLLSELESVKSPPMLPETLRFLMLREKGEGDNEIFASLLSEAEYDLGLLDNLQNIFTSLGPAGNENLLEGYADRTRQLVLDKNQGNLRAAVELGWSLMAQRKYLRTQTLCREYLQRFRDSVTMQSLAAHLNYRLHLADRALFYCNKVLVENKERADMLLLKARIIWRSDREKSLAIIMDYLDEPVNERIKTVAARKNVDLPSPPEKSFWEKYSDQVMRRERAGKQYLETVMSPEFLAGSKKEEVLAVINQYYARYRWQLLFREEFSARQALLRGEYFRAAHHFTNLINNEKHSDPSLIFDLALVYGKLGQIEDEASLFRQLKRYDPEYPGLDDEIRRNRLQLRPRLAARYSYLQEEGWDGYKAMKRSEAGVGSRFTFDPREEIELTASHIRYDPTGGVGDPLSAKRVFLSSQGRFWNQTDFKIGAGVEFLNYKNTGTGLFLCRIGRKFNDDLSASLSFERDVVADTYASLTRNIVTDHSRASLSWDISPYFSAGGDYGLVNYSDSNELDEYSLWTKCHFFGKPSYLTFTYQYSFMDADEFMVEKGTLLDDGFRTEDHPYWAPRDYWENSFSLNWRQSISNLLDEFEYPGYYSASFTVDYDERGQLRQTVEGGIYLEWARHFIGRSTIKYTASENYDVREFSLAAVYRW